MRLGCGQPDYHHDPFYCGPECEWYEPDEAASENERLEDGAIDASTAEEN